MQVASPSLAALGKRAPWHCECSLAWPESCRDSPSGPVCHLVNPGSPNECLPDFNEPCAPYPDGTVSYCDGFCGI